MLEPSVNVSTYRCTLSDNGSENKEREIGEECSTQYVVKDVATRREVFVCLSLRICKTKPDSICFESAMRS